MSPAVLLGIFVLCLLSRVPVQSQLLGNLDVYPGTLSFGQPGDLTRAQSAVWTYNGSLYASSGSRFSTTGTNIDIPADVYKTSDGLNWVALTTTGAFGGVCNNGYKGRVGHFVIVINNTFHMYGGGCAYYGTNPSTGNGVPLASDHHYYSTDFGVTWVKDAATPLPVTLRFHYIIQFLGGWWIYGGHGVDSGGASFVNGQVYNSSDGLTWTAQGAVNPDISYFLHSMAVFNNALYMVGGRSSVTSTVGSKQIAYTTDGVTFTVLTPTLSQAVAGTYMLWAFTPRNGTKALYRIGGSTSTLFAGARDIDYSTDGVTWTPHPSCNMTACATFASTSEGMGVPSIGPLNDYLFVFNMLPAAGASAINAYLNMVYAYGNTNDCMSAPCMNGGSCVDGFMSYSCQCPGGYSGSTCSILNNNCASNPCLNGGSCTNGIDSFVCKCLAGFGGTTCLQNDNCASNPCVHGTCNNGIDSFTCSCTPGFQDARCQTQVDNCVSLPCMNGGSCQNGINSFSCACIAGYNGTICQQQLNYCQSNPCRNGASCIEGVNSYNCSCAAGFHGTLCDVQTDNCVSGPCKNGATCVNGINSFSCSCFAGYNGTLCENWLDDCASSPCQNGGNCTRGINSFLCTCRAGYAGSTCQTAVNYCASAPCMNGGSCQPGINSFTCVCPSGYSGVVCATANFCFNSPCKNNATCATINSSFACTCRTGFSSAICDLVDPCTFNMCQNGGTCVSSGMINTTVTTPTAANAMMMTNCTCPAGFSGVMCAARNIGSLLIPSYFSLILSVTAGVFTLFL